MPKSQLFLFRRTNTVEQVLCVYETDRSQAEVKASVGPIEHVLQKEGVELISEDHSSHVIDITPEWEFALCSSNTILDDYGSEDEAIEAAMELYKNKKASYAFVKDRANRVLFAIGTPPVAT